MTDFNVNALTPEQIERIKANGGFSGSMSEGMGLEDTQASTQIKARSTTPIRGYGSSLRPQINSPEGKAQSTTVVSTPSPDFAVKLGQQETDRRTAEAKANRERNEQIAALQPTNILKRLEYTERKLKALEKRLKALESSDKEAA